MGDRTEGTICSYVARKCKPETWNSNGEDRWFLDADQNLRGLDIDKWHCPHPVRETDDGTAQYCVFHAEDPPDEIDVDGPRRFSMNSPTPTKHRILMGLNTGDSSSGRRSAPSICPER